MNVTPSTGESLLDVRYDWDGSMIDPQGNYVYDSDSITELQYYGGLGIDISNSYYSDTEIDYTAGLSKAASGDAADPETVTME